MRTVDKGKKEVNVLLGKVKWSVSQISEGRGKACGGGLGHFTSGAFTTPGNKSTAATKSPAKTWRLSCRSHLSHSVSLSLPLFSKVEPPLAFPREGCARLGWLTPIAAGSRVPAAAFTVRLRQSREPAFPVLAFDRLAGVKQGLLLITEDAPMALQALTAVGEGIDGQADAMHASRRRSTGMKPREQRG